MNNTTHPHDERLAALAGGDPEVAADAALRAHVGECHRCGPLVADLASLRSALAELPDLAPSRPIQLVPPAPAAEVARGGALGRLRRLWAPVMAAGAGLAVVGAVGLGGMLLGSMAAGGAAAPGDVGSTFQDDDTADGESLKEPHPAADAPAASADEGDGFLAASPAAEESVGTLDRSAESPAPDYMSPQSGEGGHDDGDRDDDDGSARDEVLAVTDTNTPTPWLVLLGTGAALVLGGLVLRFTIRPRAG